MRAVAVANHHPRLRFDRRAVARVIHTLDARHDALATRASVLNNPGELSLVFFKDAALARIHADFLGDPTVTDVITFEGNPALGTAGEICVSADAAIRHVASHQAPAARGTRSRLSSSCTRINDAAFSRELTLYVVHGWLHLAGYDDLVPAKKRIMRRAEARAMAVLETEHALPSFRLAQ